MWQLSWMLNLLPDWFWWTVLIAGGIALCLSWINTPYKVLLKIAGLIGIFSGTFMIGMAANEAKWELKVKELEAKVAAAEADSKKENIVVQEKIVKQKEYIKGKTEYITRYIDKEIIKQEEVIKYIERCPIPQPIIDAHNAAATMNNAAEGPKK